jgi:hypothetical protein
MRERRSVRCSLSSFVLTKEIFLSSDEFIDLNASSILDQYSSLKTPLNPSNIIFPFQVFVMYAILKILNFQYLKIFNLQIYGFVVNKFKGLRTVLILLDPSYMDFSLALGTRIILIQGFYIKHNSDIHK